MAGTLRFTRLRFRAGPAPAQDALDIEPATVVVLVGPNNSGKSLALREIETWCTSSEQARKVIDTIEVDFPTDIETAKALLEPFIAEASEDPVSENGEVSLDWNFIMHRPSLGPGQPMQGDRFFQKQINLSMERNLEGNMRSYLTRWHTIRLDGRRRFELTDEMEAGDLGGKPANHLVQLAQDSAARDLVRNLTFEAFQLHFVLDFLKSGRVRIRMSRRRPQDDDEELALSPRAQAFHGQATLIEEMGDGVRSFTGLVAAVLSLPQRILLVDEPEAFLHPPLARRLGAALAAIAHGRSASLIIATHSAEVVLGCLESVSDTTVVRLEYDPLTELATAQSLAASELASLARNPLLRSTDVLRALFHRGAVICEGDTDRVFYDEMNRRLLDAGRGVRDALFLNALNKQTILQLVGPLRRIGVPAAAIADLDMIKPGGKWRELLAACGVPNTDYQRLETERMQVVDVFSAMPSEADGSDPIKSGGVVSLNAGDRARAEALLDELASYGLFLVPGGELETWLRDAGATGHGPTWLERMFRQIGSAADDPNYEPAGQGDVWAFIDAIGGWISDPRRKGMP